MTTSTTNDTIHITLEEYKKLTEAYEFLLCLEAMGVDNWEWFDDAVSR